MKRNRGGMQIAGYFGMLTLAAGLGHPDGILRLPIQFWLKDEWEMRPHSLALFEALALTPVYVAFGFGFLRDHWNPFRRRDQAYFILSALLAIGCYAWLATGAPNYPRLLAAILVTGAAYQLIHAAGEALMTSVAQREFMTGRLSALNEFGEASAGVLAALAGGWLVSHASMQSIFLLTCGISGIILVQGFWRPRVIFPSSEPETERETTASLRVLIGHRALWPSALIILLWSFSPGYHTPLLYYLTEDVSVSSEAYGLCQAVDCIGITVATAIYVWLCPRISLRRLLKWTMALGAFPGLLFLLVNNATQAVMASFVLALLVGFMNTSIGDLLARAAPEGLEGSFRMFGVSAYAVGGAIGDVSGAWIYEKGGLLPCLLIEAVITLCIFPTLRWLPQGLIDTSETGSNPPTPAADARRR